MATRASICKGQITKTIKKIENLENEAKSFLEQEDPVFTSKDKKQMAKISERLKNSWESVEKYLTEWKELEEFDAPEYDKYLNEKGVLDLLDKISDTRSDLTLEMSSIPSQEKESNTESSLNVQTSQTIQTKLRPFELPKFNGNPVEWSSFYDLFKAMVDGQKMADVQKLCYLREALTGPAFEVIHGLKTIDANYTIAIKLLKGRYDKGDDVRTILLNQLDQLRPSTNASNTRTLLDRLNVIIRQLQDTGIECNSQTDIHRIQKLLPHWLMEKIFNQIPKPADRTCEKILATANEIISQKESLDLLYTASRTEKIVERQKVNSSQQKFQPETKASKRAPPEPCAFCQQNYWNSDCPNHTTNEAKTERARQLNLCFKCLSNKHKSNECQSKFKCFSCEESHHRLLACNVFKSRLTDKRRAPVQPGKSLNSNNIPLGNKGNFCGMAVTDPPKFIGTVIANESIMINSTLDICSSPGQPLTKICSFLDTGSAVNLITKSLAEKLKLILKPSKVEIQGVNEQKVTKQLHETSAYLWKKDGAPLPINLLVIDTIMAPLTIIHDIPKTISEIQNWDIEKRRDVKSPDLLLGIHTFHDINYQSPGILLTNGLKVSDSDVGLWVSGNFTIQQGIPVKTVPSLLVASSDKSQAKTLADALHKLDELGISEEQFDKTKEDELVQRQFNENVELVNNRYRVRLPWRENSSNLPTNFFVSFNRLRTTTAKLQKDPDLLKVYDENIKFQLQNGIIEEIPAHEHQTFGTLVHYLPHHAVFKRTPQQVKLRVVFDASAKERRGAPSLNDCLYRGPVILDNLFGVLIRVRTYKKLISADVEKAFLQVEINPIDRDALRFLWLKDPELPFSKDNISIFRFKRVTFGVICSPSLLGCSLMHLFTKFDCPISQEIKNGNLYVDNVFLEANTTNEVIEKSKGAIDLFKKASMNLREFVCNDPILLNNLPKDYTLESPLQKILGIHWNTNSDLLEFCYPKCKSEPITKRKTLEIVASLFDPLGLIAPTTLQTRHFIQTLWKKQLDWDKEIGIEDKAAWSKLTQKWQDAKITIPRLTKPTFDFNCMEMHAFADASILGYGASIYVQYKSDKSFESFLIASKSRVVSLKRSFTIPELELLAVLLAAKLLQTVQKEWQGVVTKTTIWSDSEIVLHWLKSSKSKTRFVQNQLNRIYETEFQYFCHIPTDQNPADVLSRGTTPSELQTNKLWWKGPEFLNNKDLNPPMGLEVNLTSAPAEEKDKTFFVSMITKEFDRSTSWQFRRCGLYLHELIWSAKATIHVAMKWRCLVLHKKNCKSEKCSKNYFTAAKKWMIQESQKIFPPRESDFANLSLYTDEDGTIRCKGRIDNSNLSSTTKRPIYVRNDSPLAKALILHYHNANSHAGPNITLAALRQEFWVPKGRLTVQRVIKRHCLNCRPFAVKPFEIPKFPQLPKVRTNQTVPFQNTGLDLFGPFRVKNENITIKAYSVIFTCMTTRAVHLETIINMTSEQILSAFQRFISRRGLPKQMWSDNAENIKCAADLIKGEFSSISELNWTFITPLAPWRGGFYERLIAIVKDSLKRTISKKILSLFEFTTLLTQVESVLNNRPLTVLTENIEDSFTLIRPVDFLRPLNTAIDILPPGDKEDYQKDPDYLPKRTTKLDLHELVQIQKNQLDKFWSIWHTQYLTTIRERQKAMEKSNAVQREPFLWEPVLIESSQLERNQWRFGLIHELIKSSDGIVRTVKVKTHDGFFIRAINQIYPLEIFERETPKNNSTKVNILFFQVCMMPPSNKGHSSGEREERRTKRRNPIGTTHKPKLDITKNPGINCIDKNTTFMIEPHSICKDLNSQCSIVFADFYFSIGDAELAGTPIHSFAKMILIVWAKDIRDRSERDQYVKRVCKFSNNDAFKELTTGHERFNVTYSQWILRNHILEAMRHWTSKCSEAQRSLRNCKFTTFGSIFDEILLGTKPIYHLFASIANEILIDMHWKGAATVGAKHVLIGSPRITSHSQELGNTYKLTINRLKELLAQLATTFFRPSVRSISFVLTESIIDDLSVSEVCQLVSNAVNLIRPYKQITLTIVNGMRIESKSKGNQSQMTLDLLALRLAKFPGYGDRLLWMDKRDQDYEWIHCIKDSFTKR